VRALDVMRAVRDLRDMSVTQKAVLFVLVLRCGDDGTCFPSAETIAADAGLSVRAVRIAIKELVAARHVAVERRTVEGRSVTSLYRVHVVQAGVNDVQPGVNPMHGEGEPAAPPRVNDVQGEGERRAHRSAQEICPVGTAQGTGERFALSPVTPSVPSKLPKKAKHTVEEIVAKTTVLEYFCTVFELTKRCAPRSLGAADHDAAFKLAKAYGVEEARKIIDRAFADPFVVNKNSTLRFIASKADTFCGATSNEPPKPTRIRNPLQASGGFAAQLKAREGSAR
jgi:hypothetical protein